MVRKLYLIGAGLGNVDTLTLRAKTVIDKADLLIGAQRLMEQFEELSAQKLMLVKSEDIAKALRDSDANSVCVLFSGDIGFFSGATRLRELLADCDVESIPGISSLGYFCARIGVPWQDVHHVSAHGRACNIAGEVQTHKMTFFLTGGKTRIADVCEALDQAGLGDARVWVGERLSYADERVVCATAHDLRNTAFADLSVMLVENEHPIAPRTNVPSLADNAFVRGSAPMTKEEVRALVIFKLRLYEDDVVWDIGAGTGSISIEAARSACRGSVYAIEKDETALELLRANQERFCASNLHIVPGEAPNVLNEIPRPDSVFIGGSSGNLSSIIEDVLAANPHVRLCATAITLETLSELLACIERFSLIDVDIAQVSVAKAKGVAQYHMMSANNPIYLISASGACEQGEQA